MTIDRRLYVLDTKQKRRDVSLIVGALPQGTRIEIKGAKRTLPQNDRFWAMCTDVSEQLTWHGVKLSPADWRLVFLDALKREVRIVPNIDGTGFVNLGRSSSDLSKEEMTDVIEIIHAFGAQHEITFHDGQGRGGANNVASEAA